MHASAYFSFSTSKASCFTDGMHAACFTGTNVLAQLVQKYKYCVPAAEKALLGLEVGDACLGVVDDDGK